MFVGHLAVALLAKRARPQLSLGWSMAGVNWFDLVWPAFLLLGWEQVRIVPGATAFTPLVFDSYPWSHSLVMGAVWGLGLAAVARSRRISGAGQLLVALVLSHWVLDFVTHAPDMPLWPGASSPRFGLALWNSIPGTIAIEGALWVVAIGVYLRARKPTGRVGTVAFWSLVLISTAMWISGPWMAPPPNARALGWFALIGWIMVPWAAWADRHHVQR